MNFQIKVGTLTEHAINLVDIDRSVFKRKDCYLEVTGRYNEFRNRDMIQFRVYRVKKSLFTRKKKDVTLGTFWIDHKHVEYYRSFNCDASD